MKRLLSIFTALVLAAASAGPAVSWIHGNAGGGPPPPTCETYPGLTCDANGFTVFTPVGTWCEGNYASSPTCIPATTDTQIIYIAVTADVGTGQAAGIDQSGCGTWAAPCQTVVFAGQHYGRASTNGVGSPDWFLLKCGDVWNYASLGVRVDADLNFAMGGQGGAYGNPTTGPLLLSSYDASIPHVNGVAPVPNPTSCSARPEIITSTPNSIGGIDGNGSMAVVGLANYCPGRDPNNTSTTVPNFNVTDAQAAIGSIGFSTNPGSVYSPPGAVLLEDNYVAFCGGGITISDPTYPNFWYTQFFARRNVIINSYSVNSEESGIFSPYVVGGVSGNPANHVYYQNVVDNHSWINYPNYPSAALQISWAPRGVFSHNIYVGGISGNGDVLATSSPITFDGNVLSNDPSGSAFRTSGLYNNNLFVLDPRSLPTLQPNSMTSSVNKNVFLDMTADGSEFGSVYVNEDTNVSGANITTNIFANSPQMSSVGAAITFNASTQQANNNTVTGNYMYNVTGGSNTNALSPPAPGGIIAGTFTAGSSYIAKSSTITSAAASNQSPTSQNYVVLTVADQTGKPNLSLVYSLAGNLGTIAGGPRNSVMGAYQAETCPTPDGCNGGLSGSSLILFGSNFSGSYTGSVYFPYGNVSLSCISCHCTGVGTPVGCLGAASGFTADVIVDGSGHVVAMWLLGNDGFCQDSTCSTGFQNALQNTPGVNFTNGDTLSIPALGGTGSGAVFTVTQVASNNVAAANNVMDAAGTNGNGQTGQPWVDPNRTAGWYYAMHVAGATAKATFTGVVASGVLTVSGITGTLYPGDAVVWTSPLQTISDYIKADSGGTVTTLGSLSATACSTSPAGCAAGSYTGVTLYGGHGTGATADITVGATACSGSPCVTVATLHSGGGGSGYIVGDVLTAYPAPSNLNPNAIGIGGFNPGAGASNGFTNFTVQVATITPSGTACVGGAACTGKGGSGTYALTGLNQTVGMQSMSSYSSEQLVQAEYNQSKHNWSTALTAPVINSVIAAGFGLTW